MEIKFAEKKDANVLHTLMVKAFMEYEDSSALKETVQSISIAIENGEKGLIAFLKGEPVGMVRFQLIEGSIFFFRLSVMPEKQGQGIAKTILQSLEDYAHQSSIRTIHCKVRKNVPRNIHLYRSMGFDFGGEEVIHNSNDSKIEVVSMKKQLMGGRI